MSPMIIGELLIFGHLHLPRRLNLGHIAPLSCCADNFMDLYKILMNRIVLLRSYLAWLAKCRMEGDGLVINL